MEEYEAYETAEMLWKIISPILIIFGTAGNVLVITLLTRKRSRNLPTSVYLSALAMSDLITLNTGLMRQWIKHTFHIDIRVDLTVFGCRFHWFIVYLATQFSSWMLICVTLERLTSTLLPHRRRVICTMKSSLIAVLVILVFLVLLNGHFLFGYGNTSTTVNGTEVVERCVPLTESYDKFILYSWTWIDLCVFFIVPMTVLLVGNSLIIHNVVSSHRKSRRSVVPDKEARNSKNKIQTSKISSLTISLLLVSLVFCICITPIVVFPIGEPYWSANASTDKRATLFLIESLANLFMYVNHSINFILYFMSGKRFRDEVKQLFCRFRGAPETEVSVVPSKSYIKGCPNTLSSKE